MPSHTVTHLRQKLEARTTHAAAFRDISTQVQLLRPRIVRARGDNQIAPWTAITAGQPGGCPIALTAEPSARLGTVHADPSGISLAK